MTVGSTASNEILRTFSKKRTQLLELLVQERSRRAETVLAACLTSSDEGPSPVAAAQQRLWLIDLEGGGAAYHIPVAVRLTGALDRTALQQALNGLVQRHDVLRTVFVNVEGEPMQKVQREGSFSLQVIDLRNYCREAREERVGVNQREETLERFDLSHGPLIRGRLLVLGDEEHVLLITIHHIIFDAWSMSVFARELGDLYRAFSDGRDNPLAPLPTRYADFARSQRLWLQGEEFNKQLKYWHARLQGAPVQMELPADRPRPSIPSYQGARVSVGLGAELSGQLKSFAQRQGMTLFMVSYAACAILLSRLSGEEDVVIGTPVANRSLPELEGLIGFFINTLVFRAEVFGDLQINAFLEQVKMLTLEAYDHQDVPFEHVVEALQPPRVPGRNPLFQVMLVVQNAYENLLRLPGLTTVTEESPCVSAKFDLLLSIEERDEEIVCSATYSTDLFDRGTIEGWLASFTVLLRAVSREVGSRIRELPLLSEQTLRAIESFNSTRTDYPKYCRVHELFEDQVKRTPDLAAVKYDDRCLTYSELDVKAEQLARYLRGRGVGPDRLVGICVERTPELVVGLLAILKSGGAYLPLDPNYPVERLQHMLHDADPHIVLTQEKLRTLLPATRAEIIPLDTASYWLAGAGGVGSRAAEPETSSHDLVYVIYTSGSTGLPKGTAMGHRSMVNLIEWHRSNLRVDEGEHVLQFAALSFDVAFQEIFTTLCMGGTLVLLDEWIRRDTGALTELLQRYSIQRLFGPPLMLQSLAETVRTTRAYPESLRDVITAGEQLRISPEIADFFRRLKHCRLHNHYGPTETHVVTSLTLTGDPDQWPVLPSIGRPIANTRIHILDSSRRQVPIGAPGEIYIGGDGVARGYLGRLELTAQRFIEDSSSTDPEARLYKTGDMGRWRLDGTIDYMGRNDHQVKIRGYRIELGEIEAHLARHEQIKEAVVVAREDVPGEKRLVGYFTALDRSGPNVADVRAYLKSLVPDYMVPGAFVRLELLPLTPSGKLDRRALPPPQITGDEGTQYETPMGRVEDMLAQIWQELLHVQRIGRHDNFFELGGHSLLAVKSLFKINRQFDSALKVTDIYRNPTVRELAALIDGCKTEDRLIDLADEAALDDSIVASQGPLRIPAKRVLLTGATGFVGRFLLAQLLKDTEASIYCLVRAPSKHQAMSRLRSTLSTWDLWRDDFEQRIVAVPGDLRLPCLGMEHDDYHFNCSSIDSIFHSGTSMNHLETYGMAKAANVDAAKEIVKLATLQKPKLVNYISTFGVFSQSAGDAARVVDEQTPIEHERHWYSRGYVSSKWVGEKIFMTASERGIPCNIFRIGLVWPDTEQGRYDELQHGYRILKPGLLSRYGIKGYRTQMVPTPVDYVSRAIVFLAQQHGKGRGVFHISSSGRKIEALFERCNEIAGTRLELKSFYDWICEIKRLHHEERPMPAVPLIEFAFSMDERSFNEQQHAIRAASIRFDCTRTQMELERAGITAPELDDDLLRKALENMLSKDPDLQEAN